MQISGTFGDQAYVQKITIINSDKLIEADCCQMLSGLKKYTTLDE